jgi:hypothetical protein
VGRFSATELAAKVPARAWMRRRTGNGTKRDRHYDWALIDVLADDAPVDRDEAEVGHAFLVVRRHRYTRELSFYRYHSTTPVSLAVLANIICTRWKIEEDSQGAKGLAGLDQGQVTCWNSWMRWSLISLFAAAVLAVTHAATRTVDGTEHGLQLAPASGRELLAVLPITALPTHPAATSSTPCTGLPGAVTTGTRPLRTTADGTTSPRRRPHDRSQTIKTYSCRDRRDLHIREITTDFAIALQAVARSSAWTLAAQIAAGFRHHYQVEQLCMTGERGDN